MKHPLVITPEGKLISDTEFSLLGTMKQMKAWLNNPDLRPTRYYMTQNDYYDILKWSRSKP